MKHFIYYFFTVASLCVAQTIQSQVAQTLQTQQAPQEAAYNPQRYKNALQQMLLSLNAKKNMLEKKLGTSSERLEQAMSKGMRQQSPGFAGKALVISQANKAVVDEIASTLTALNTHIQEVQKEIAQPATIHNKKEEERAIQRINQKNTVTDLEIQLQQNRKLESYLISQKAATKGQQNVHITMLLSKTQNRLRDLESKLRNAHFELSKVT